MGNGNPLLRDKQELCLVSLIAVVWLGTLPMEAEWGEELVVRAFEVLPVSPDVKSAHKYWALILGLIPQYVYIHVCIYGYMCV